MQATLLLISLYGSSNLLAAPALAPGCDYSDASLYSGYGWHRELGQSCDPVINEAFGTPVELTRAIWDGSADIANRTIQCDLYYFDQAQQRYLPEQNVFANTSYPSYQLRHLALSPTAPFEGWKTTQQTGAEQLPQEQSVWSVQDGIYRGGGPLDYPDLELITLDNGSKAVRRWVSDRFAAWNRPQREGQVGFRQSGYFECRDTSGRDFSPTGRIGVPSAEPVVLSNLEFTVSPNSDAERPGSIFNLETGEAVALVKARWHYNRDIAGSYSCVSGVYSGNGYSLEGSKTIQHPHHYTDSQNRVYFRTNSDREEIPPAVGSYEINSGVLQFVGSATMEQFRGQASYTVDPLFMSEYVELTDSGVRVWQDSNYFEACSVTPSGGEPASDGCDYSSADLHDGWGWNPQTRESCPPQTTVEPPVVSSACDYSGATSNGGWGWNPQTRESCPPQTTVEPPVASNACDYSSAASNGGWGWNATTRESCAPR